MQFTESWLKSLVHTSLDAQALAEQLTMAGLEVEELEPVAPAFSGVVVGRVISREKHPDADRLSVCLVDVGDEQPRQIVCGASNVAVGLNVPCALPGAVLPGDFTIKPTKMRGVESGGMLCSAKELGLAAQADGLYILPDNAPTGLNIREYLQLDDLRFTLKMTPNRADCLSVWGVAREVAALTGAELVRHDFTPVECALTDVLPVHVLNNDLCGRFAGRIIRQVNNQAVTPAWMVRRLEQAGQRSVSPLVDISNYVMLELGRPTHVFDLSRLNGSLQVRWAKSGEKLTLLNDQLVELTPRFGVIADDHGPQALAGIMGGSHTSVSESTTDIFVEAAFWHPDAIAGRARELNFSSGASHRFERGVDFLNVVEHLEWMTRLILEICGGQAAPIQDQTLNVPARKLVTMRHARAEQVIGMPLTVDQVSDVFSKLGLTFTQQGQAQQTVYSVQAPSWRFDIEIEEDLIEEVVRVVGYENLPLRAPIGKLTMLPVTEKQVSRHDLRHQMAGLGYQEVVSYSFVPEKWEVDFCNNTNPVRLINPIASHLQVMRSGLIGSFVEVLRHNRSHRADRLRVFEVARTFAKDPQVQEGPLSVAGYAQTWKIGGLAWGLADQLQWSASDNRAVDFFDVKGDLEALLNGFAVEFKSLTTHPALHPGRSAAVLLNNRPIGFVGELHPQWVQTYELVSAPIVFELDVQSILEKAVPMAEGVSRLPVVVRDLALVADRSVHAADLKKALLDAQDVNSSWIKSVILFDEFVPEQEGKGLKENEKSLAFRIVLQASDRNLTDVDVDSLVENMLKRAQSQCAVRLR